MPRSLSKKGHVRLNGTREKSPGHAVKNGDVLTVALDSRVRVLKIKEFVDKRGDASAGRALYDELQPQQK